jgi:hypothetical protein
MDQVITFQRVRIQTAKILQEFLNGLTAPQAVLAGGCAPPVRRAHAPRPGPPAGLQGVHAPRVAVPMGSCDAARAVPQTRTDTRYHTTLGLRLPVPPAYEPQPGVG